MRVFFLVVLCLTLWIVSFVTAFNFFHNEAGVDVTSKLSFGGFSQIMSVYVGSPPQPIQCLVHGGDSFIVVGFDPSADGWNAATYFDEVLQTPMMYFTIGSFSGHLPIIYSPSYIFNFNNSAIACIFGLGRANPIYWSSPRLHWGSTKIFFNEMSDSTRQITCERFDTAMCTFDATYKINDTIIGYAPTQLSNNVPYTVLPVDLFNSVQLLFFTTNYWNDITICNDTCFDIPSMSYLLQLHNYIQKTIFPTNVNHSTLGVTVFRNLDVSVDSQRAIITWKERSFALINSLGIFIVWSFFLMIYAFLIMTPAIRHVRIPKMHKMYAGVRTFVEFLVLLVVFFVFLIPDYYENFVLEFGWFHYMFLIYIGITCLSGFLSMVFNQLFASLTVAHYYMPIISCLYIILLLSLFNFTEGSPTIVQTTYSFIIGNYFYAVACTLLFPVERPNWIYVPMGLFFGLLAIGWSMFSASYFIIPTIQQYVMLKLNYLYALWPLKVLVSMIFGAYHAKAAMAKNQILYVHDVSSKKRIKND